MDPRLLYHYNRELQFVREMGGEFAREYPKIAGRLGLESLECADPYVERLLESFAFLTARIQLKLDDEFPRFTHSLLEMVCPQYLAPTPSMAVVELHPSLMQGSLDAGYVVPRGTTLKSALGADAQTACEYRTAQDVTLWPIEMVAAEYGAFVGDIGSAGWDGTKTAKAALRLRLRGAGGRKLAQMPIDRLALFLRAEHELASRLYEQLVGHALGLAVRSVGGGGEPSAWHRVMETQCVTACGLEPEQALLPCDARSFDGYRLLQEYFAFPARFLFVELSGLAEVVRRCDSPEIEVVVVLGEHDRMLDGVVDASHLRPYCTPAVNLVSRRADRIHLTDRQREYHVVPDRARPLDFEVHSVQRVQGYGDGAKARREFRPFYGVGDRARPDEEACFYTLQRRPRKLSANTFARGRRSGYVGSETFLSLVDGERGPYGDDLKQLGVDVLCTNRDLPLHMALGRGRTDFSLETGAPVDAIRCVAGPTAPRASNAHGDVAWRLLSHLSLNYLSITDGPSGQGGAALREVLSLYGHLADPATCRQIEGITSVSSRAVTRVLPVEGPIALGRGLEVTVRCDEDAFEGVGAFMLGTVLARFFAKYVSINAFVETVVETVQRGEIQRWPARVGTRQIL